MSRYIDADLLRELIDGGFDIDFDEIPETKKALLDMIDYQETADVRENVHGKWIKMSNGYGVFWVCSNCEKSIPRITYFDRESDLFPKTKSIDKTNFCPNCGAKMDGE